MRVLVVIPAHNEALNLPAVVGELRVRHPQFGILVVDDGSTDGTADVLARLPVAWLRMGSSVGIGGAMQAGFRYAQAENVDAVVRLDGDGQHDVESIEALLAPIVSGAAAVVRGSRYLVQENYRAVGFRRLAQRVVGRLLSWVTGETVTDPTCGFWAFGSKAIDLLAEHHPTGYPEPELLLLLHRNRLRTVEAPVRMRERIAGRSSLAGPRTALAIARVLLAIVIVPLRPTVSGQHS